jgi:GTP-binding protein
LLDKPRILAVTKMDLVSANDRPNCEREILDELPKDLEVLFISSVAHVGLDRLRTRLWAFIEHRRQFGD